MVVNLNAMAEAVAQKKDLHPEPMVSFVSPSQLGNEHFHEYTQNTITLFEAIEALTLSLSREV
jgi:hypothetical protein